MSVASDVRLSHHMPPMANEQGLACHRIALKSRKKQGDVSHVLYRGEFLVHSLAKEDFFDDAVFTDAKLFCLLWYLFLHQWRQDEAGTDHNWHERCASHPLSPLFVPSPGDRAWR